ncbi:MAG: SGNH/GDSL hydrolase family protein [Alphaproteobacteria bacterium]
MPKRTNLLLLGASLLVGLAAVETMLRFADLSYPEFHRLDPMQGWSPRPGVEGWWNLEGGAYLAINREGFRDREHSLAKPAGGFRIAVLGDSYTEARAIPTEKTFWSILERRLKTCAALAGRPVEVLNFGVSGYGTTQELITLRRHVLKYRPDLVLLAFYAGNDVWNNSRALDRHPDRPYLVMRDGAPVIDRAFRDTARFRSKLVWQDVKHGVVNSLYVLQLLKEGYHRLKVRLTGKYAAARAALDQPAPPDAVYLPPPDATWREAWRVTEQAIGLIHAEARAAGAAFWLALLSTPIQVHPDPAVRARFLDRLGGGDLAYPDRRLAAFAGRQGIPVVTLAPDLREYAQANHVYLHGFAGAAPGTGHWNATAHALAGARIARTICAALGGAD